MNTEDQGARARKTAEAKFGFYKHAIVYVVVSIILVIVNFVTSPGSYWFVWPIMGWGIAIVLHASSVFLARRKEDLLDRMTEHEMPKRDWGRK